MNICLGFFIYKIIAAIIATNPCNIVDVVTGSK